MDNEMLMKMFTNMMQNMSEAEIQNALNKAKTLLGPNDYEKLVEVVKNKKLHF